MRRRDMVAAIQKGILDANTLLERWSGGFWVHDRGVEGLMVSQIAQAIYERGLSGFLDLEVPFHDLEACAGAKPKRGRRPSLIEGRPRIDLAVFNAQSSLIAAVEVKRGWVDEPCSRDIDRLWTLIQRLGRERSGSLQCGLLGFFDAYEGWDPIEAAACSRSNYKQKVVRGIGYDENRVRIHASGDTVYKSGNYPKWLGLPVVVEITSPYAQER